LIALSILADNTDNPQNGERKTLKKRTLQRVSFRGLIGIGAGKRYISRTGAVFGEHAALIRVNSMVF
jgi:hypothetical protein